MIDRDPGRASGRGLPLALVGVATLGFAAVAAVMWAMASGTDVGATASPPAVTVSATPAVVTPSAMPAPDEQPAQWTVLTARAGEPLDVTDTPGGHVVETLDAWTALGQPLTVLAVDEHTDDAGDTWYQVQLPARPGHELGWVSSAAVDAATTTVHIDVFLAEHELVVSDGNEAVLTTSIASGAAETPTPLGLFYVTDPLDFGHNPSGVYGAYALGLSGYSEVLATFDGGPPQIAIHGTNQPELIGQSVSNGCIRMTNDAVVAVADAVELGSPVLVHASREEP